MKELTLAEMEQIQAGDGCSTAATIAWGFGAAATVLAFGAFTVATGGLAWGLMTAYALSFSVAGTGVGLGALIACTS